MKPTRFSESLTAPGKSLCNFCEDRASYWLVPRDLEPDDFAPTVCAACFETLYWVLEYFPGDGSEVDGLHLKADQDAAINTVEMLIQFHDGNEGAPRRCHSGPEG